MYRRERAIIIVLGVLCLLAAAGYTVYSRTVRDYVDCASMLSKVYQADASDLTFHVTIDTAGQAIDTEFRAVRFPFQDSTATQVTIFGIKDNYTFYKVNGRNLTQANETNEQSGIPRNYMELIAWGRRIYQSDLEIRKVRDRGSTTYTVDVPDDMVQSFMDAYLGKLEVFELKYKDCRLTLTGNGKTMTQLALQGTAEYRILFVNTSTNILVRARVNALGNQVSIPNVPDYFEKAAS